MNGLKFVETVTEEIEPYMLEIHKKIWELAEISSGEFESSKLLMQVLRDEGFSTGKCV